MKSKLQKRQFKQFSKKFDTTMATLVLGGIYSFYIDQSNIISFKNNSGMNMKQSFWQIK